MPTIYGTDQSDTLPYWIDALLWDASAATQYRDLLGSSKTYYFGFPESPPNYIAGTQGPNDWVRGWETFSAAQREYTRLALESVAAVIDVKFEETTNIYLPNTLAFHNRIDKPGIGARAAYPGSDDFASDVFFNADWLRFSSSEGLLEFVIGEYPARVLVHEVGHAIGLHHPKSSSTLPGHDWTMMWMGGNAGNVHQNSPRFLPLDVATLQYVYGVNPTSRAGDDTYIYDPDDANFIWDGAGIDTIDASASTSGVTIYLFPGNWGFKGNLKGETIASAGQITVNFGTVIENLKGSNLDDKLIGNSVDNEILGNAGDDIIEGGDGNDSLLGGDGDDTLDGGTGTNTLDGGQGEDTVSYALSWARSDCAIFRLDGVLKVTKGDGQTDTLLNSEKINFSDQTITISSEMPLDLAVSEFSPADDISQVSLSSDITITFSEAIKRGSGDITLKTSNGTVVATYNAADSANLSISDKTLTVNPGNNFNSDTSYELVFAQGSIVDLADNPYTQIGDYTFTTIDTLLPTVSSFSPANDATDAGLSADIAFTFSEAIERGTGDITLKTSDGSVVATYNAADSTSLSISDKTLTINPTDDLSYNTSYTVVFAEGSILDLNANSFTQASDYTFTTKADDDKPFITYSDPYGWATQVAVTSNITITFNEAIKLGTGDITLKTSDGTVVATYNAADSTNLSISDKTLTINPSDDLNINTTYELTHTADSILDLSDNSSNSSSMPIKFSTVDTIAPTVTDFNYPADVTIIGRHSDIAITFSEPIKWGAGEITLETSDGTVVGTFTVDSGYNSLSDNILTIRPYKYINPSTSYKLTFSEGSITDDAGNPFTQTSDYQFTTVGTTLSGSSSDDKLTAFENTSCTLYGYEGDDLLGGSGADDTLAGGEGDDKLWGEAGNDTLNGGDGDDTLDGGTGIDTAIYSGSLSDFTLTKGTDSWAITTSDESDSLVNIERIQFANTNIALDLDGNAGKTAKLLAVVLGVEGVSNKVYVGAGLYFLDGGMTYEELMQVALDVVLGANPSSSSVVDLLWTNIVGPPTPADNLSQYSALIDNGTYTAAELAVAAADHNLNTTNIDLIGLSQTGLEYDIFYG